MPATTRQMLGERGELAAAKLSCRRCKREKTVKRLPRNFKCADLICDFCGYLAQVKSTRQVDIDVLPKRLMGAAWGPQHERMEAGVFTPLFVVVFSMNLRHHAIYFLPPDLQMREMFQKRKPLSPSARRSGWVGCTLRLDLVPPAVRVG